MMKNLRNILCPLVFCLFLGILSALLLLLPQREYSEEEKRYLATTPAFSWQTLLDGTYTEELEACLEDQFPGREVFVSINAYWQLLQGRNAQQSVYYAEDGYLINDPEARNTENFEKNIRRFNDFAAGTGLPAGLLLVPSTGYMLQDKLPVGHGEYADETLYAMASELLTAVELTDPRQALSQTQAQVFYRTDHHLTSAGNHAMYAHWRSGQGKDFTPAERYRVETLEGFRGTTWSAGGYRLVEPDTVELWDSGVSVTVTITDGGQEPVVSDSMFFRSHAGQLDLYPVFLDGNHTLVEIENPDAPAGTILLIKDSYAHGFAPFLAEHYSRVLLLDLRFYRGSVSELIETEQVEELLFVYGTNTLLTDTNSAWLF